VQSYQFERELWQSYIAENIRIGAIGFMLLVTHKGLSTFLDGLDEKIEKDVDDDS